ncbi:MULTISPECIES: hypothetical protein [unclassified Modestobacter]
MTDTDTDTSSRSPAPDGRAGRAVRWWLAAATFVLGIFTGGLLVGLLAEGSAPVPRAAPVVPGADADVPLPEAPPTGETAEVLVNAACLRAMNGAQDVVAAIDDLGEAASQLNAVRLDEVVRRLQPLQGRLRTDIAACVVVTETGEATPTGTAPGGSESAPAPSTSPAPPS